MKIKKCPHCVYYIHFDGPLGWTWCWNCGQRTDFSKVYSPEERLGQRFDAHAAHLQLPAFNRRLKTVAKVALAAALPFAVVMLLVTNSFDMAIVRDRAAPYTIDQREFSFHLPGPAGLSD